MLQEPCLAGCLFVCLFFSPLAIRITFFNCTVSVSDTIEDGAFHCFCIDDCPLNIKRIFLQLICSP